MFKRVEVPVKLPEIRKENLKLPEEKGSKTLDDGQKMKPAGRRKNIFANNMLLEMLII